MDADAYALTWLTCWNAHDVEGVLSRFAADAVFSSPYALTVLPGSTGILRGKAAIRSYWTAGLALMPNLRFDLVGVYGGVDTVVINYRSQSGALVNEVLTFSGGLVVRGAATYLTRSEP